MKQVYEYPPIYDEIIKVFPVTGEGFIYAWGNIVYNPSRVYIPPALMAHEEVHGKRQGTEDATIRAWWANYLFNAEFRLQEEVLAHVAEYHHVVADGSNRAQRRKALSAIAGRLSSKMYGNMITKKQAEKILKTYQPGKDQ